MFYKKNVSLQAMGEIIISVMPMMVCSVMAVLLAIDLCSQFSRPRLHLFVFMLVAALLYSGHFVFFNEMRAVLPVSDTIYCFSNLAVYPLFYIYIEVLTHQGSSKRQMLYLLPSLAGLLVIGTLYALMSKEQTDLFIEQYLYHDKHDMLTGTARWQMVAHHTVKFVFALQIPFYFYWGSRDIRQFNKKVETFFSNTEGKELSIFNTLLLLFVAGAIMSFVCNIIGRNFFGHSTWLLSIPAIFFSILILLIGHAGLSYRFTQEELEEEIGCKTKEVESMTPVNILSLKHDIEQLVESQKLYLQPNLKTSDLATRLNTNREYIYQAINSEHGESFSAFINRKRIDHAAHLMEQDPKALLKDIAHQSGFASTTSFYRNWKLFKNYSPSKHLQNS